jgi:hypothetical protein
MASELVSQIQHHLAEYLDGNIELHELEDRLVPMLWDLHENSDEQARELVGEVEILIAEASRGDRPPDSLRNELREVATRPFVECRQPSVAEIVVANYPLLTRHTIFGAYTPLANEMVVGPFFGHQELFDRNTVVLPFVPSGNNSSTLHLLRGDDFLIGQSEWYSRYFLPVIHQNKEV